MTDIEWMIRNIYLKEHIYNTVVNIAIKTVYEIKKPFRDPDELTVQEYVELLKKI